jgi:hypothetical protein
MGKAMIKAWVLVCDEDRLQKWKSDYELPLAEVQFHPTDKLTNGVPSIEASFLKEQTLARL